LRIKVSRRGVVIGLLFGIAATLLGIVVIEFTDLFILVVLLWPVVLVIGVQLFRWIRKRLER